MLGILSRQLWIAFIFQYLWDTQQLLSINLLFKECCELLSFFSIFGIHNNYTGLNPSNVEVVNCFHFSVSLGYTTTVWVLFIFLWLLWIAFIFQYLWDTQQQGIGASEDGRGCELLSFFSIFGIHNNLFDFLALEILVVNCFHFSVSLGYTTTN